MLCNFFCFENFADVQAQEEAAAEEPEAPAAAAAADVDLMESEDEAIGDRIMEVEQKTSQQCDTSTVRI